MDYNNLKELSLELDSKIEKLIIEQKDLILQMKNTSFNTNPKEYLELKNRYDSNCIKIACYSGDLIDRNIQINKIIYGNTIGKNLDNEYWT